MEAHEEEALWHLLVNVMRAREDVAALTERLRLAQDRLVVAGDTLDAVTRVRVNSLIDAGD